MTIWHSTVMHSADVIKSSIYKLKKDNLGLYIVWNRKFTANLVLNVLSLVVDANYLLHALPQSHSDTMQFPQNPHVTILVHENDQVMAFFNKAILDNNTTIALGN